MTGPGSGNSITIEIDGLPVAAGHHEPLLDVARRLDLPIPSLCHHPDIEPLGACRLCVVEHRHRGRSRLVASCTFPVEDGMSFLTDSEIVRRHRRMIAELLLARCPEVPVIRELAARLGVECPRFAAGDGDTCILCGLCTRVCESYATAAISLTHRGDRKAVGALEETPPGCVGCGGCALVCPTGHIAAERAPGVFNIWNREFSLAVCAVDRERCTACGACEEACPFSVPRVVLRRDGGAAAEIRADACRGCGVCIAACPSAAISSPRAKRAVPAPDGARLLVIGCPRSGLLDPTAPVLPAGAKALELPCAGGVGPGMLLSALALGYGGVLVLGRHQRTCRLDGAEDHARAVVSRVERLAGLLGLGPGRVRFAEPAPGREGPVAAVREALADPAASPILAPAPADLIGDDLAHAVGLVFRLGRVSPLTPSSVPSSASAPLSRSRERGRGEGLSSALDLLFEEWLAPEPFSERIETAPETPEEALRLLAEMLPGRRGAWRRSGR